MCWIAPGGSPHVRFRRVASPSGVPPALSLIILLGFDDVIGLIAGLPALGALRTKPACPISTTSAIAKLAMLLALEQLFTVVLAATWTR